MRSGLFLLVLAVLFPTIEAQEAPRSDVAPVRSIAIRCANVEKMRDFYAEAFGGRFRPVQSGNLQCFFGDVNGMTLKLVPLREKADFEGYPMHQLGFGVADVAATVELAVKHGGRREGEATNEYAAVRDPDGNTIELYRSAAPAPAPGKRFLVVYEPGPNWIEGKSIFEQPGLREHASYHQGLWREGRLLRSGPFRDANGGATVLVAPSREEAQKLIDADPAIKDGILKPARLSGWFPVDWARYK
ncbi:MAG: VOC family protein [Deltaproteobacteria bacterium]|nr:MAG: VOC family protein [Deltaproteobacteria bacterium]